MGHMSAANCRHPHLVNLDSAQLSTTTAKSKNLAFLAIFGRFAARMAPGGAPAVADADHKRGRRMLALIAQ